MLIGSLCSSDRALAEADKENSGKLRKRRMVGSLMPRISQLFWGSVQAVAVAYGPPYRKTNAELLTAFKSPVMQPGTFNGS